MIPLCNYLLAAHEAGFHVQVEYSAGDPPRAVGYVPCTGRVQRVFPGSDPIRVGDVVNFSIPGLSEGEEPPTGAERWFPLSRIREARVAEVFVNGRPPDLELADHGQFCSLLGSPTEEPVTPRPSEDDVLESFAKSWGITPNQAGTRLRQEQRETEAKHRLEEEWSGRTRKCPACGTSFTSVRNRGSCPSCGLVFFASHPENEKDYPL